MPGRVFTETLVVPSSAISAIGFSYRRKQKHYPLPVFSFVPQIEPSFSWEIVPGGRENGIVTNQNADGVIVL